MTDWLRWLVEVAPFTPRRDCAGLDATLVWSWVASDAAILLSYSLLSVAFAGVVRRRHDRSIWSVFFFLGVFVFLCGLTHGFGVLVMWWPAYRLGALVNAATAVVSVAAAVVTLWYTPKIMRVPSVKDLYEQQVKVRRIVVDLLNEIVAEEKTDPQSAKARMRELERRLRSV